MIKELTKELIYQEFELATHGMDFTDAEDMRQLLLVYFCTGALWAQDMLMGDGIVNRLTQEEINNFLTAGKSR